MSKVQEELLKALTSEIIKFKLLNSSENINLKVKYYPLQHPLSQSKLVYLVHLVSHAECLLFNH